MAKTKKTPASTHDADETADLRIKLDAETTKRLDRVRQAAMGEVSRTKAATHIIVRALADTK